MDFGPRRRRPWDHDRLPAPERDLVIAPLQQFIPRQSCRGPAAAVDAIEFPLRPYQGEDVAAQAVAGRLQDSQAHGRSQGSVDGVAAFFQHIQPGLGSQGLRRADHAPAAIDHFPVGAIGIHRCIKIHSNLPFSKNYK